MGWDILEMKDGRACFYCRTGGMVFGPLLPSAKAATAFSAYLAKDPRRLTEDELERLWCSFRETVSVDFAEKLHPGIEEVLRVYGGHEAAARQAVEYLSLMGPSDVERDEAAKKEADVVDGLLLELGEVRTERDQRGEELREAKAEIARLRAELDSCPIGRYCGAHETRHVGEAEELRSRFEDLAERWKETKPKRAAEVRAILGAVDARDSLRTELGDDAPAGATEETDEGQLTRRELAAALDAREARSAEELASETWRAEDLWLELHRVKGELFATLASGANVLLGGREPRPHVLELAHACRLIETKGGRTRLTAKARGIIESPATIGLADLVALLWAHDQADQKRAKRRKRLLEDVARDSAVHAGDSQEQRTKVCSLCDGKGYWFDASHGCNRRCSAPDCGESQ